MIHLLDQPATYQQVQDMLEVYPLLIKFESLINIRPRLGNLSIIIQSEVLRQQVADIICEMLKGI